MPFGSGRRRQISHGTTHSRGSSGFRRPAVRSRLDAGKISQSGRTRQPIGDGKSPTFTGNGGNIERMRVRVGSTRI
ncbi:hypothetical protein CDS [Bradyrhizobium sp.]|nr:hypothetical protein CDS [Bradyrhizobium sp.]